MIQTSVGEVENKSMFDGKTILEDAPQRYKNIKLPPDWYAGPGKRKKRRHRKSHGMFSFLDLSRVIAASWKELPTSDPETLSFVQKIAKSELEKYYQEMKEYKELIKCIDQPESDLGVISNKKRSISTGNDCNLQCTSPVHSPRETITSMHQERDYMYANSPGLENDASFSLNNSAQQLPSLFEFENHHAPKKRKLQQRTSTISYTSDIDLEVDLSDDHILDMWKSANPGSFA